MESGAAYGTQVNSRARRGVSSPEGEIAAAQKKAYRSGIAFLKAKKNRLSKEPILYSEYGTRTRVTDVRGQRPNH